MAFEGGTRHEIVKLRCAARAAVENWACQSLGSAASRNSGAGDESSMRTTVISMPKKRASSPAISFRKSSAWRYSSRNSVAIHTTVAASVPAGVGE